MTKPIVSTFNEIAPLLIQQYEHYLPTAFDESMSLLQKVNKLIQKLDEIGLITNEALKQWNLVFEWVMNEGLTDAVNAKLDEMVLDGTLDDIINIQLFGDLMKPATAENLQSIIDDFALRNVKLTLKRATFEITSTLLIPSNMEIDWNYSTVKRKTGAGVFDLIRNKNNGLGDTNIKMYNLLIDGNKTVDVLVASNDAHRFSGIRLQAVTDSFLRNITVKNTVNSEDQVTTPAAGILFSGCSNIKGENLNGFNNDRTAILLVNSNSIVIDGSLTHDNAGSGISSNNSNRCKYLNIETYNNGYSNLSVNGVDCTVDNVLSHDALYSGVNLGHNGFPADRCQASNIISYNNTFEGITIGGSADVQLNNVDVYENKRHNIQIFDGSSKTRMSGIHSKDCSGGFGIFYSGGKGHKLDNATIEGNLNHGVYVTSDADIMIGDTVEIIDNGQGVVDGSGIVLNNVTNCSIGSVKCGNLKTSKKQDSGIWIVGGGDHSIIFPKLEGNITNRIKLSSSPTNLNVLLNPVGLTALVGINGWTLTNAYCSRDGLGNVMVTLEASGGTGGQACCTLPIGFRPFKQETVASIDTVVPETNNAVITTGGDIKPNKTGVAHIINAVFRTSTSPLYAN